MFSMVVSLKKPSIQKLFTSTSARAGWLATALLPSLRFSCPNDVLYDVDEDGFCGDIDNCPETWNYYQADTDNDGIGNNCDNCPYPNQEDADNDGTADGCDNDTIYGYVTGEMQGDVIVGLYRISCGVDTLLSTRRTDVNGYYAFGNINNGAYIITPYHYSYIFVPESDVVLISQTEIRSYDFTAIED
jgi:hypothetical protein